MIVSERLYSYKFLQDGQRRRRREQQQGQGEAEEVLQSEKYRAHGQVFKVLLGQRPRNVLWPKTNRLV